MYLPPLCLDVLKDELVRLFDPGNARDARGDARDASEGPQIPHLTGAGKAVLDAARCAASLALCGHAQLTELALSLYDRVVDPGCVAACTAVSAAASERDVQQRAAATASLEALRVAEEVCSRPASLLAMRASCKAARLPVSGTKAAIAARVAERSPAMRAALQKRLARDGVTVSSSSSSRSGAVSKCPVSPRMKMMISRVIRSTQGQSGQPEPPVVTLSLLDAMFLHRIPFEALRGLPCVPRGGGTSDRPSETLWGHNSSVVDRASRRLRIDHVHRVALSRAVEAHLRPARPSTSHTRKITIVVRQFFPDVPPEMTEDCIQMLMDSDPKVNIAFLMCITGQSGFRSLPHIVRVVRKANITMERRRVLTAALHAEGLLPSDSRRLYMDHTKDNGPTVLQVVTSARFRKYIRCPTVTNQDRPFLSLLKHLWNADVDKVVVGIPDPTTVLRVLTGYRTRMVTLIQDINGSTTASSRVPPELVHECIPTAANLLTRLLHSILSQAATFSNS